MLKDLANGKMMLVIENENQYAELISVCNKKEISICKPAAKRRTFPIYFCFVEILKTGDVYLVPGTNESELSSLGWEPYKFKNFKQLVK